MVIRVSYTVVLLLVYLLSGAPCEAQFLDRTVALLRGSIQTGAPLVDTRLWVELANVQVRGPVHRSEITPTGAFEFRSVPVGQYMLKVTSLTGDTIHQEYIEVEEQRPPLEVRLQKVRTEKPLQGVVSVRGLQQSQPPKKALEAVSEASRLAASGKTDEAVRRLGDTVRRYPDFAGAHTNLGVLYARTNRTQDAEREFREAARLGGDEPVTLTNLAYTLAARNELDEASTLLRRALQMAPDSTQAHYLLGYVRMRQDDPDEALFHLERSAPTVPRALVEMARIHVIRGEVSRGVELLRAYLKTGDTQLRPQVETWITKLTTVGMVSNGE